MQFTIDVAIAKTHKYASRESGDTAEVIERPAGGLTLLVVDGQGSGRSARVISQMLVARAIGLLKDGVRDGVVARAANDVLLGYRHGQVSATLGMVSVDLPAGEVIVTHHGGTLGVVRTSRGVELLRSESPPLGRYRLSRPEIWRFPIEPGALVIVTSDGISGSGQRIGHPAIDLCAYVASLSAAATAREVADGLLEQAIRRDTGKPADDCTVGVVRIGPAAEGTGIRTLTVHLPVDSTPRPG